MEWDGTLVVLATPPMSGALWDASRKRVEREVKWFAVIIPDPGHDPVSRAKVISVDAERVAEDFSVVARVGLFELRTRPSCLLAINARYCWARDGLASTSETLDKSKRQEWPQPLL